MHCAPYFCVCSSSLVCKLLFFALFLVSAAHATDKHCLNAIMVIRYWPTTFYCSWNIRRTYKSKPNQKCTDTKQKVTGFKDQMFYCGYWNRLFLCLCMCLCLWSLWIATLPWWRTLRLPPESHVVGSLSSWPQGRCVLLPYGLVWGNTSREKQRGGSTRQLSSIHWGAASYLQLVRVLVVLGPPWPLESTFPQSSGASEDCATTLAL